MREFRKTGELEFFHFHENLVNWKGYKEEGLGSTLKKINFLQDQLAYVDKMKWHGFFSADYICLCVLINNILEDENGILKRELHAIIRKASKAHMDTLPPNSPCEYPPDLIDKIMIHLRYLNDNETSNKKNREAAEKEKKDKSGKTAIALLAGEVSAFTTADWKSIMKNNPKVAEAYAGLSTPSTARSTTTTDAVFRFKDYYKVLDIKKEVWVSKVMTKIPEVVTHEDGLVYCMYNTPRVGRSRFVEFNYVSLVQACTRCSNNHVPACLPNQCNKCMKYGHFALICLNGLATASTPTVPTKST
jgi:hypothetical protein